MKIVTKRTIKRECWDLDYSLIKWLNEHLKVYLNEAQEYIDLGFNKFDYKGTEYTEEQIIIRMIEITNKLKNTYYDQTEEVKDLVDELYDLLKIVHFALWW